MIEGEGKEMEGEERREGIQDKRERERGTLRGERGEKWIRRDEETGRGEGEQGEKGTRRGEEREREREREGERERMRKE